MCVTSTFCAIFFFSIGISFSQPTSPHKLANKGVFMVSIILNRGIFYKAGRDGQSWREVCSELVRDPEMFYHWLYLSICLFGWLGHEFLYCALVGNREKWLLRPM